MTEGGYSVKKRINELLVVAVIVPVILLFWPFVRWNDAMALILRVIPSIAVQILLYRIGKWGIIKVLPTLISGAFAAWGMFLFSFSSHWSNATLGVLIADYVSPFISCAIALIGCVLLKKKVSSSNLQGTDI